MSSFDWIDPRMKRNTRTRFQMGNGSSTVSYYPPQDALNVGRNPSPPVNQSNLPAIRQSGALALRQPAAIPSILSDNVSSRNFSLGQERPVSGGYRYFGSGQQAAPSSPQLQIGYDGPKERISLGQVRQNLNKGKFVGPPAPEGYAAPQSQTALPNEGFVGPKNMGAFTPRTTFGGSHVVDPSGSLAGELYRNLSKSTGRYIPGLEQMWGGQPNADEWKQGTDDAYQQARSGLKVHPMNTQYKNHGMSATGFPSITAEQRAAIVGRQDVPQQEEKAQDIVYGKTPGSAIIKDAITGKVLAQGSGPATGGFSRPSTADANLAFEDEQNRLVAEQSRQDQLRREYNDELQGQRNFDGNINWALNNPKAPGAAVFLAQLQQGRKIGQQVTPLSDRQSNLYKAQSEGFSKEAAGQNQLAEARTRQAALPYIGPKAEAETGLQNAQAGYYQTKNPTELGTSRSKDLLAGYLAKQKQSGKEPTLSEMIKLKELRMVDPQGYEELMQQITKG